jgi:hypothetical protein
LGGQRLRSNSVYFGRYISLVSDADILTVLQTQWSETAALLRGLGEKDGGVRYAPDKWSVREVLGHMNDTERIFAYRALRIARADKTPLAGFEQDDYVLAGGFEKRAWRICAMSLMRFANRVCFCFAD